MLREIKILDESRQQSEAKIKKMVEKNEESRQMGEKILSRKGNVENWG